MNEFQGHLWDTEGKPIHDVFQSVTFTRCDLPNGMKLKYEGIKQVSQHNENWLEDCVKQVEGLMMIPDVKDFTGEDLRFRCSETVGEPYHPNSWGALVATLLKRKIIVPTGEYRPMKDRASHARRTPVYRRAQQ